jgi:hypothetical protein
MNYRLYWTDREISLAEYQRSKGLLWPKVHSNLDDALRFARDMGKHGSIPWEIEGDDGTKLDRKAFAETLQRRSTELAGPPKVY